jgi:hypothetical protein
MSKRKLLQSLDEIYFVIVDVAETEKSFSNSIDLHY